MSGGMPNPGGLEGGAPSNPQALDMQYSELAAMLQQVGLSSPASDDASTETATGDGHGHSHGDEHDDEHEATCDTCGAIPKEAIKRGKELMIPEFNLRTIEQQAPLLALSEKIKTFFKYGPDAAFDVHKQLALAVSGNHYTLVASRVKFDTCDCAIDKSPPCNNGIAWKTPAIVLSLVLMLAASERGQRMSDALRFMSTKLKPGAMLNIIRAMPPADLTDSFERAKKAALERGKTTVLGVHLVDVHILELARRGAEMHYYNFDHGFLVGVGPQGVIIWQGWGKQCCDTGGYQLDNYINDGHARLRNWAEAEQFVKRFEQLTAMKGVWTPKVNKLYKALFSVDLRKMCAPVGKCRPVTPKFNPWVRIHTIDDVSVKDVNKFFCGRSTHC